jgi:hypothetical protein
MPETTAFTCFSTTFLIQMQHAEPWFHGNGMLGTCRNLLELGPAKVPSPQRELSEVLWDISVVHVSSEAPTIRWDLCKGCSHFSWLWLIVRFPPWTLGRSSLHYTYVYIYMCVLTCLAAAALVRVNNQHDSTKSSFYILVTWSVYVCSVFIIFALLWRTLVGAWLGPSSSLPLRIRSIVLRSLLALLVLAGRVEKEADGSVQSRLRWVSFEEKKAETQRHLNITECLYIVVNYKCCKFISLWEYYCSSNKHISHKPIIVVVMPSKDNQEPWAVWPRVAKAAKVYVQSEPFLRLAFQQVN